MSLVTAKLTRDVMAKAREVHAADLLAWESVAAAIGAAAVKGHGQAVFGPPAGVIIKGSATAETLKAKLEATGFRCDWRERRDPSDVLTHELVVSWEGEGGGAARAGGGSTAPGAN